MKIGLNTDFVDFYDDFFDAEKKPDIVFTRFKNKPMLTRKTIFEKLELMNQPVIPQGKLEELAERFWEAKRFVVYTDEYSHLGQGKILIERNQLETYKNNLASLYFNEKPATSLKKIVVGEKVFWFECNSDHAWKSNLGKTTHNKITQGTINNTDFPLYTIDYVFGAGVWWAIDLNLSPKLTELENEVPSSDIVLELKNWYERLFYG